MVLIVALLLSCNSSTDSGDDESSVQFEDGISLNIKELLGDELLYIIENDLEMPIHRGNDPPDIEAVMSSQTKTATFSATGITVLMKPLLLHRTNVPSDEGVRGPGFQFADYYLRFQNQNVGDYTIDVEDIQLGIERSFSRAFIIGADNKFTLFGPAHEVINSDTVHTVKIFSGTITNQGISSPYHALVMVDNADVGYKIPNKTGRSFTDGDNIAIVTSWPEDEAEKFSSYPSIGDNIITKPED